MIPSPIPLLGTHPKEFIARFPRDVCTFKFQNYSQSQEVKATPVSGCINKTWYIRTREYYVALKRKEIRLYATT